MCIRDRGELARGTFTSKELRETSKKIAKGSPCKVAKIKKKAKQLVAAAKVAREEERALASHDNAAKFHEMCARNNANMENKTRIAASICSLEDPLMGLRDDEVTAVRLCQTMARVWLARGGKGRMPVHANRTAFLKYTRVPTSSRIKVHYFTYLPANDPLKVKACTYGIFIIISVITFTPHTLTLN